MVLYKSYFVFLIQENIHKLSEINTFEPRKQQYLPHYYRSEKGFMGTVVNWALLLFKYSVP